jgi:hypothetical protein
MTIDTVGYKAARSGRLERRHAEAQSEAMRDEVVPQLATKADLDRLGDRLDTRITT